MSVKLLPVLAISIALAGCNRQQNLQPATSTTTSTPSPSAALSRNPEPVERTVPQEQAPSANAEPITARVVDDARPSPLAERSEVRRSARRSVTEYGEADRAVTSRAVTERSVEPRLEPVIPASTRIRVRLGERLDTRNSQAGERFVAYLDEPIVYGDRVIVPKGTPFRGHIVEARKSGRLRGRAYLGMTLDSFRLHGTNYVIATRADVLTSNSHKKRNAVLIGGGSGTGAAVGGVAGGGVGALIGAGAGAVAGTTGALITGRRNVNLPAETPLVFSLRNPVRLRS